MFRSSVGSNGGPGHVFAGTKRATKRVSLHSIFVVDQHLSLSDWAVRPAFWSPLFETPPKQKTHPDFQTHKQTRRCSARRFLVILLDATLLHTDRLSTLQLLGALITVLGGALRFTNAAAVTVTVTFGAVHPVTSTVSSYMAVRPKRGGGDGRYGRVCTDGH